MISRILCRTNSSLKPQRLPGNDAVALDDHRRIERSAADLPSFSEQLLDILVDRKGAGRGDLRLIDLRSIVSERCCGVKSRGRRPKVQEIFSRPSNGSAMIEEFPFVTDTGASSVKYSAVLRLFHRLGRQDQIDEWPGRGSRP